MIEKFQDAGSMLWMNLDERERQLVIYGALWVMLAILNALREGRRARLVRELREELVGGDRTT